MRLPFDILEYVFSFLVSHRQILVACSKDPLLSPIVERHLYYHVTVFINGIPNSDYALKPEQLFKLISENPRIINHVRIMTLHYQWKENGLDRGMDTFSKTLLMFPALKSITLNNPERTWYWSASFRAALEDRMNLPTLTEIHLVGGRDFSWSLFHKCKNIKNLSLSGVFQGEGGFCDNGSASPQLNSLSLCTDYIFPPLVDWLKLRINELQSLRCTLSFGTYPLSELLPVCSGTLNKLKVDFANSPYYREIAFGTTGADWMDHITVKNELDAGPLLELSPLPPNLQQLTIRTAVHLCYWGLDLEACKSWLPVAAETINLFIGSSPPQHLVLDINLRLNNSLLRLEDHLAYIDFSPLAVLGPASLIIPRIDLNVRSGTHASDHLRTQFISSLQRCTNLAGTIKMGVLFIHSRRTAPGV